MGNFLSLSIGTLGDIFPDFPGCLLKGLHQVLANKGGHREAVERYVSRTASQGIMIYLFLGKRIHGLNLPGFFIQFQ
jgi:hypothetical protein